MAIVLSVDLKQTQNTASPTLNAGWTYANWKENKNKKTTKRRTTEWKTETLFHSSTRSVLVRIFGITADISVCVEELCAWPVPYSLQRWS